MSPLPCAVPLKQAPSPRASPRPFVLPVYSRIRHAVDYVAAGVLVYARGKDGLAYLLLGHERRKSEGWCFMIGTVDKRESPVAAAAREMHEESCGVYSISTSRLKGMPCFTSGYQLLFVAPAVMVDATVLNELSSLHLASGRRNMAEMSEYLWVRSYASCLVLIR